MNKKGQSEVVLIILLVLFLIFLILKSLGKI